jgi:Type IV secretion system pilin
MFYQKVSKLFTRLQFVLIAVLFVFSILGTLTVGVHAVEVCTIAVTPPTFANIAKITDTSHYPIIPADCKGPISPTSLPGIITRAYGFISSLGLNLLFFYIVYCGFLWIYGGLDGGKDVAKAKKNLESAVTGFALILFAYLIVTTFVSILVDPSVNLDIQNYFKT